MMKQDEHVSTTRIIRFSYSKNELLKAIANAVKEYREYENKPAWQPIGIDTATITRYIAYGQFEAFIGSTQHPRWVNLYNRVNYFLNKLSERNGTQWIFYRDFEEKVSNYLSSAAVQDEEEKSGIDSDGSNNLSSVNKGDEKFADDFVVINFEEYIEKKVIYTCKHCHAVFYTKTEALKHIKTHPLRLFLTYEEKKK